MAYATANLLPRRIAVRSTGNDDQCLRSAEGAVDDDSAYLGGRDAATRQRTVRQCLKTYEAKYPKAADCLRKHRNALMAFEDFPAEHRGHWRTTTPSKARSPRSAYEPRGLKSPADKPPASPWSSSLCSSPRNSPSTQPNSFLKLFQEPGSLPESNNNRSPPESMPSTTSCGSSLRVPGFADGPCSRLRLTQRPPRTSSRLAASFLLTA